MARFTVSGSSDDLIEIDGDISEEWGAYDAGPCPLRMSDGTVLVVTYDEDGRWRIAVDEHGDAEVAIRPCPSPENDPDDKDYSDVATIEGDVAWVSFGGEKAWANP